MDMATYGKKVGEISQMVQTVNVKAKAEPKNHQHLCDILKGRATGREVSMRVFVYKTCQKV